ncbi:hypothetical protein V5O48_004597 [Marasmius crinis-equi]|uniref:Uncharacterized protein n=1 Tax=Marasmius crinis-equi TaxID=585013 RepID=A0ABR3FPP5_9AGAR
MDYRAKSYSRMLVVDTGCQPLRQTIQPKHRSRLQQPTSPTSWHLHTSPPPPLSTNSNPYLRIVKFFTSLVDELRLDRYVKEDNGRSSRVELEKGRWKVTYRTDRAKAEEGFDLLDLPIIASEHY